MQATLSMSTLSVLYGLSYLYGRATGASKARQVFHQANNDKGLNRLEKLVETTTNAQSKSNSTHVLVVSGSGREEWSGALGPSSQFVNQ
jgi:hypothetical protein